MKKIFIVLISAFLPFLMYAQCNIYFDIEAGQKWTYENFDSKDKITGRNEISVISFDETSTGYVARLNSIMYDKKDKEMFNGEMEYRCKDGVALIDMKRYVSETQLEAFGAYDIQIESENLEIPNKLEPNMELKDGSITIKASNSPIAMTMNVMITDRKVEAQETVEVPAGTYEAYKISSKTKTALKMGMSINKDYGSVQWYAEKVGMVRSESFDERGRLVGFSVLTKRE